MFDLLWAPACRSLGKRKWSWSPILLILNITREMWWEKRGAAASLAKEEWRLRWTSLLRPRQTPSKITPPLSSAITKNSSDETSENIKSNQNQKGEERSPGRRRPLLPIFLSLAGEGEITSATTSDRFPWPLLSLVSVPCFFDCIGCWRKEKLRWASSGLGASMASVYFLFYPVDPFVNSRPTALIFLSAFRSSLLLFFNLVVSFLQIFVLPSVGVEGCIFYYLNLQKTEEEKWELKCFWPWEQ